MREEWTIEQRRQELSRCWKLFCPDGAVIELRAPKVGRHKTVSGYFNEPEAFVKAVEQWNGQANLYFTLNPVEPGLLARAANRAQPYAETTTSDDNIPRRRWLLIDLDAKRPAGISATEQEHAAALARAAEIHGWLCERFGAASVLADSGNGGHVLLPVDLPNDADTRKLLETVLKALGLLFSDVVVEVDEATFNASRICKIYGSLACKGDSTPERPHRYARFLHVSDALTPVPRQVLEEIAALLPETPQAGKSAGAGNASGASFDVPDYLANHNLRVGREGAWKGGYKWVLETCPFNADHGSDSMVFQLSSGAVGFKCLHNGCIGNDWHTLRDRLEPGRKASHTPPGATAGSETRTAPAAGPQPTIRPSVAWPDPLAEAAFHGLAGDVVRTLEPHTESDPVALLVQFLVGFGNLIGRSPYYQVEADQHHTNLFAVIVGNTSMGRKGTSWGQIKRLLEITDDVDEAGTAWHKRLVSGLSSGEGLIWNVRDPIEKQEAVRGKGKEVTGYQTVIADEGEEDKRLLVTETEFSNVLNVLGREGNTLSAILRDAWDRGKLSTLTKNSPARATDAHISIIGHITRDELRQKLTETEAGNGFANRFLWVVVQRSKLLPDGGSLSDTALAALAERIFAAATFARDVSLMARDPDAGKLWHEVYGDLTKDTPGLLGSVTTRAAPQVLRMACLYALLDSSSLIRVEHLSAALAVWQYAAQSAAYIFGDALGDPVADDILRALRNTPEGMTRNQIRALSSGHTRSDRIGQALELLESRGMARMERRDSDGGRPAEVWFATPQEGEAQA